MDKTSIGNRLKLNYENRAKQFLTRRTPVIMRIDGKTFSTYTKGLNKPFDEGLIEDMQQTAIYLCENIQGAKCAYVQSDEISILITDYDKLTSDAWFDYNIQEMISVSASLATAKFNQLRLRRALLNNQKNFYTELDLDIEIANNKGSRKNKSRALQSNQKIFNETILAIFNSKVFNIPKEKVANYFIWRQQNAVRNSISMLAQSLYSHKKLHQKNTNEMQEMSFQKGHNWNDLDFNKKRGSFIVKVTYANGICINNKVKQDYEIGDLWYQPKSSSGIYPSEKGRLLQYDYNEMDILDWCDIPIKKIRTKWEVVETPMTFNNDNFKEWL